jgi:hypothetical protein
VGLRGLGRSLCGLGLFQLHEEVIGGYPENLRDIVEAARRDAVIPALILLYLLKGDTQLICQVLLRKIQQLAPNTDPAPNAHVDGGWLSTIFHHALLIHGTVAYCISNT